jgi:hypothetical protein
MLPPFYDRIASGALGRLRSGCWHGLCSIEVLHPNLECLSTRSKAAMNRKPEKSEEAAFQPFPGDTSARTPLAKPEAEITNLRYRDDPFWVGPKGIIYGNLPGSQPAQVAHLYPDGGSTYFFAQFKMPADSHLEIHGHFPHARYMSFTVATQLGHGQLGGGDFLRDDQIDPAPGSVNPFLPGADRYATPRNFTLRLVHGIAPHDREPNTLYTNVDAAHPGEQPIHLAIRNYISDVGWDGTGNAELEGDGVYGLPKVVLRLPGGIPVEGEPMREILRVSKASEQAGYSLQEWLVLVKCAADPTNAPAPIRPAFQRFWNTAYSTTGSFASDPYERVTKFPPQTAGGFANNPDTIYLFGSFSTYFGEVVVIRGKMPTSSKTRHRDKSWATDTQVRYWSITSGASAPSGVGWSTIFDEEVPLDAEGNYTIVMSWPENRPANATKENGVAWLDFGDGEGHYVGARIWVNTVYIRYMDPNPDWPESPANIPLPTPENPNPQDAEVMGAYYPRATYMSRADFERLHEPPCH